MNEDWTDVLEDVDCSPRHLGAYSVCEWQSSKIEDGVAYPSP